MKNFKDVAACIDQLRFMQSRNDIGPEQRRGIERVLKTLEKLRRNDSLTRPQAFRYVREITETLIDIFVKR